jgi:4-hydroxy-4-methyl-2-oxoglutarate aldolase
MIMNFKVWKSRLEKLDAACICDAQKNIRVMDHEIRPITLGLKMIGKAHTVRCRKDFLSILKGLDEAGEDEVLVVDAEGEKVALAGELFSAEARRKGLAGMIIDGGCRDTQKIRKMRFPVYARYITPLAGTAQQIFETQIPVECGSVSVLPGDIILGDDDGIVVMSEEEIIKIVGTAEIIQQNEEKVLAKMEEGKSLFDMLNFREHYGRISQKKKSQLFFRT